MTQARAKVRRLLGRARFHGKVKKLRTSVEVVEGSHEEIHSLAQEAEDLRYKTCVVKRGKFIRSQDTALLVFGKDGKMVQNVGSALRKTSKARHWGGSGTRLAWRLFSSEPVQDAIWTWLLGWFITGKERVGCEQVKD